MTTLTMLILDGNGLTGECPWRPSNDPIVAKISLISFQRGVGSVESWTRRCCWLVDRATR